MAAFSVRKHGGGCRHLNRERNISRMFHFYRKIQKKCHYEQEQPQKKKSLWRDCQNVSELLTRFLKCGKVKGKIEQEADISLDKWPKSFYRTALSTTISCI